MLCADYLHGKKIRTDTDFLPDFLLPRQEKKN